MFNGERVREMRKQRDYTLQELAEKTGLSIGLLSQIERGIVDPTVGTFWKICTALNVPIHHFFQGIEEEHIVVRKDRRRLMELSDSNVRYHILSPNRPGKIEYLLVEIEPGDMIEKDLISHSGEECGFVIQGEMKIILDQQEIVLNEGDSICFPSTTPHRYVNIGSGVAVSIWAMVP
ncbi:helix-turn-helix domain-containing protein [Paenibacillus beijingensis]|uniref:XRE family transcriptional regulator n=1 Tax=Paenibacillus beijingensis TaxID=1126833 RepID=A0A0D5NGY2_9BACL|nr:XRE family transcriptional regulator [Paenibacillus beijingensis]AJY74400.1 XRE family transcriptional regulator [Paenibacillus beijingensis]